MPQATAINVADGATSPVAHTFTPIGKDEKGVLWFEQTNPPPSNILAAKRIGYKQTRSTNGNTSSLTGSSKVVITLTVPTLETVGTSDAGIVPPPRLAYKEVARVEIDLAERSTRQERVDTLTMLYNLLNQSAVRATVHDLQPIYI